MRNNYLTGFDLIGVNPHRLRYVSGGDINPQTGRPYAVNPSSGVWDDNYFAQNFGDRGGGGGGGGGFSFQMPDPVESARKMQEFYVNANQPAIQSLQASIPETSARFGAERTRLGGEKQALPQRYNSIMDEIKRREGIDVSAQERVTSREFGRRLIS